jgi:PIN domain nuclease of toxin-antitoxin system
MRVLLDTNAFLRWMAGTPLPRSVERLMSKSGTECLLSVITGWEIILKPKLGISVTDIEAGLGEMRATLLPIKFKHLHELATLPVLNDHRDPFDRMLIAQAIVEELLIVTSDHRFADYKRVRILWDS